MNSSHTLLITSRDNTHYKQLRSLAQDNTAYRKQGRVWLEGDHLCRAALTRGYKPVLCVTSPSCPPDHQAMFQELGCKHWVLSDALFRDLSSLPSPSTLGMVVELPSDHVLQPHANTVVLDRVQDAGNTGSILRSAAAFGFHQIIALKGNAALWSSKVLRAGMGAHFGLHLLEGLEIADLSALQVPWIVTSSHQGQFIEQAHLPSPCAWVFGHEGQGVQTALEIQASLSVRIGQPGGEESLNVAAAAAICLHTSTVQTRR